MIISSCDSSRSSRDCHEVGASCIGEAILAARRHVVLRCCKPGHILPGGGVALLRALKALDGVKTVNAEQKAGVDIVRRAIQVPARQIVQNAGEDGSLVVGKLLENGNYNWGVNAATGEYQDLVKAGVIDPAKVVRTALQDAASVASLLITTEALVADKPKKAEAQMSAAPPMDF
ncbi:chaperonin GroEL (HSP60 family) [Bradyrhizobium sp. USDA 10063]